MTGFVQVISEESHLEEQHDEYRRTLERLEEPAVEIVRNVLRRPGLLTRPPAAPCVLGPQNEKFPRAGVTRALPSP
ncbi:hypothetical protein NGB36_19880 [Streptomyces sp. RB6PN25]|uniref:DUF5753 domain-containing protein n=1 Tax=Streptomyces humicola TaxID=2953240 RepID=A0ABT1PYP3_9ACTN|nr:hypothetical protein [Streptomyces humicola]MCQ4082803.1 hypothetical protein [Streptomyces humicola]